MIKRKYIQSDTETWGFIKAGNPIRYSYFFKKMCFAGKDYIRNLVIGLISVWIAFTYVASQSRSSSEYINHDTFLNIL